MIFLVLIVKFKLDKKRSPEELKEMDSKNKITKEMVSVRYANCIYGVLR